MQAMCAYTDSAHPARPEGLTLRHMEARDLDFLCALYVSTRAAELAPVPWPDAAKLSFLQDQFAKQHDHYQRNYPGAHFWVIERNFSPVGRVYVYRSPGEIRLMDLALLVHLRGQGLGSGLLAELIDESERSAANITLHVEAENPAMGWYLRRGFERLEDRGVYQFLSRAPVSRMHGAT